MKWKVSSTSLKSLVELVWVQRYSWVIMIGLAVRRWGSSVTTWRGLQAPWCFILCFQLVVLSIPCNTSDTPMFMSRLLARLQLLHLHHWQEPSNHGRLLGTLASLLEHPDGLRPAACLGSYNCLVLRSINIAERILILLLRFWSLNGWERHPFISKLKLYASSNTWRQVAADVETEFRWDGDCIGDCTFLSMTMSGGLTRSASGPILSPRWWWRTTGLWW